MLNASVDIERMFAACEGCLDRDTSAIPLRPLHDPHPAADEYIAASPERREELRKASVVRLSEWRELPKPKPHYQPSTRKTKLKPSERAQIRELAGLLSHQAIARRVGATRNTVWRILSGRSREPKTKTKTEELARKSRNARRHNLKKNLAMWANEGRLICLGRELDMNQWIEIMRNPVSSQEMEAFADFVCFLKHRGVRNPHIASMLETNLSEVRSALAARGRQ